jgi:hypothetical protein
MGVLGVGMAEVVGRGGDDEIDAFGRDFGKDFGCVPADDPVEVGFDFGGSSGVQGRFCITGSVADPGLSCLVPDFFLPHEIRLPLWYWYTG